MTLSPASAARRLAVHAAHVQPLKRLSPSIQARTISHKPAAEQRVVAGTLPWVNLQMLDQCNYKEWQQDLGLTLKHRGITVKVDPRRAASYQPLILGILGIGVEPVKYEWKEWEKLWDTPTRAQNAFFILEATRSAKCDGEDYIVIWNSLAPS